MWCREPFDTDDSMICHIFECPCLPNAWYWCPYHRQPERFLDCDRGREFTPKPKRDQAAKFFSDFFRTEQQGVPLACPRVNLYEGCVYGTEAGSKEGIPIDAYQSQEFKQEVRIGVDHLRCESSADLPQLKRTHDTMLAGWVDERSSPPSRRSRIGEVYGGEGLHAPCGPPAHPMEMSFSVSLRRQISPELNDSLPIQSSDGGVLANASDVSTGLDGPIKRNQHRMTLHQMSQTITPDILTSAADVRSTPTADLSSPPSNMLSSVSPTARYVFPPSTIFPPATMTEGHSIPETVSDHDEATRSFISPTHSLFDSMEKVPTKIDPASSTLGSDDSILWPDSQNIASSARELQQAKDSILEQSFHPVHHRSQFEEVNGPTIFVHANIPKTHVSDSKGSNDKNSTDKSSVSKALRPTMQSAETEIEGSRLENSLHLPVEFTPTVSPSIAPMESNSQSTIDILAPPEPSQALHSISRPHCFDCNSLPVSSSAPEHIQVAELLSLVEVVNTEWKKRIKLVPDLWKRCNTMSASSLFERAVQALRDFIHGTFAYIFEDVFAIVLLALAAAFKLHWRHGYFPWKGFCFEALQWERAISNDAEKVLFLNAMNPLPYSDIHDSFGSIMLQDRRSYPDEGPLSDDLRGTEVYKVLIGFLDGKSIPCSSNLIHIVLNSL